MKTKRRHRSKRGFVPSRPGSAPRWLWVMPIVIAAAVAFWVGRDSPSATVAPATATTFEPTVTSTLPAPGPVPEGMVWLPGGEFSMGAQDPPDMNDAVGMQATTDSRPVHRVSVDGFWMDATEVTNDQYAAFVKATGYV